MTRLVMSGQEKASSALPGTVACAGSRRAAAENKLTGTRHFLDVGDLRPVQHVESSRSTQGVCDVFDDERARSARVG
jgi:hypothetical protein